MASLNLPAHGHTLFFMETSKLLASRNLPYWGCDACRRKSTEMKVTHSYRCMTCDFDLCERCSVPIKSNNHVHTLIVTDANTIYPNGCWACDNCGDDYRTQGTLPWHCKKNCYFDLCFGCTRSTLSTTHEHPLLKTNPKSLYQSGGWMCDICSTLFKNEDPEKPYSCRECSFDLCLKCLKETIVPESRPVVAAEHLSDDVEDGPSVDTSTEDEDEDEDEDKERKQKRERKQKQKQKQEQEQEQEPQVFLSYNWNIQDRVLELKRHLESLNIKCWMDTGNMVGGDDLKREIDKGMRGAKIVISCVTHAYSQSNACQQEVALADVLKKPILPVLFESVKWPPEGPMAMPFAPLIYVSLEEGLTRENLDKVVKTIKSRTGMKG